MELTVTHTHTTEEATYSDVHAVGTAFDEAGELMITTDTTYKLSLHRIQAIDAGEEDAEVLIAAVRDGDEEWAKTLHNIASAANLADGGVEVAFEDGTEETYTDARIVGAAEDPHTVPHRRYVPGVETTLD